MTASGIGGEAPGALPEAGAVRVGYLLKMFPRLSETFILHELLELQRQGVALSIYSLMYPNDGRFHGRLADLQSSVEFYSREKPESYWSRLSELSREIVPPFVRWDSAVDFLRRHRIAGDLDLLLRAVLISARVREQRVAHLHAHFATVAARMAALVHLLTDVPFSFTAHAKDIYRTTVDWALFAELARRAAFVVTVSDYNRDFILARAPGIDETKVVRLYNGIDLGFFKPAPARRLPDVPHILSVGRLVPKKGFAHLLGALRLCKDRGLPFRCTLVGDGEERQRLSDLRDRLDLTADVELAGARPQEEVQRLLTEADVVALACVPDEDGNMDALPTVLLEALAHDVPVVSTRLTGIPEIVGDDAGILVEPGDEAAFAHAIETLWHGIRAGTLRPGVARGRAENLFDLGKNVATLRGLYAHSASRGADR